MKVTIEQINTTDGPRYVIFNATDRFICCEAREFKTRNSAVRHAIKRGYKVI